jgi:signal peptidase I
MFNKWRKYSYTAQKDQRHRIRWVVIWFLVFFTLYISLSSVFVSTGSLKSDAMQPGLRAGDRLIISSYMVRRLLPDALWFNREAPFRRGSIVLVDMVRREKQGIAAALADTVLRFFTAQRTGLEGRGDYFFMKRVIGLPGDEISITNFVARVRPSGEVYGLTEFELSDRPYDVVIPQVPALWDESLPFSGTMETIVLGENECFVLSDDRANTNDSRTWGPVPVDLVSGRALFRYWPLTRFGRP